MTFEKTNLSAKKILDKEFKTSMRGYKQDEVDLFLDIIIKDYDLFNKEIADLRAENARLQKALSEQSERPQVQPVASTNPDILRRLSNLEKHVFGNKLSDLEKDSYATRFPDFEL